MCSALGGRLDPNGESCCAGACGRQCGTSDCWQYTAGGASWCCGDKILAYGKTCSNTVSAPCNLVTENVYEENVMDGAWGGFCICPNGEAYGVADNGDYCGSLACIGGVAGNCI